MTANRTSASSLTLRCGTLTHTSGGVDYKVAEVVSHPNYDPNTYDNDIGLLKINGRFTLGTQDIDTINLVAQGTPVAPGFTVTVTGWGRTSEGGAVPTNLQTLDVPVVGNTECDQKYQASPLKIPITAQMFCAGVDAGGKDSCQV